MKFIIDGNPLSQMRHRDAKSGNKKWKYDPQSKEKDLIKNNLLSQLKRFQDIKSEMWREAIPLPSMDFYTLSLTFYFAVSDKELEVQRNAKLWGLQKCINHKDFDNLAKLYCDSMKDILLKDDHLIIDCTCRKKYSLFERTEIDIRGYKINLKSQTAEILKTVSPSQFKELSDFCFAISQLPEEFDDYSEEDQKSVASHLEQLAIMTNSYLPKIYKKCQKMGK